MTLRMTGMLAAIVLSGNASLASEAISQHGGRATDAGDYHVELVVKSSAVEVHLADHNNKAVKAAGFKGLAILVADGKSQRIVLTPAGDSSLSGKADVALSAAPKGVVQITPPNGKTVQARFN